MNNEQKEAGLASDLNNELGFNIGDAVTVLLHGDDNEYTGTVTNPKKLWVELNDYGRPFIADECSIKTIKLKPKLKTGDKFTIEGLGKSARGHTIVNGKSVKPCDDWLGCYLLEYDVMRILI